MSAFFVGADHVNAILSWIDTCHRYGFELPSTTGRAVRTEGARATRNELTECGKALLAENIASLRARYPSDWQEMVDLDVNLYRYQHDGSFIVHTRNLPVAVMKLCDCLEYQSCEHDGWPESWAFRFLNMVRGAAVHSLPGYDDAPWQYERPQDGSQPTLLSDLRRA